MQIGDHIKSIRKGKKIKQKDLAINIGISNTYLSDIENSRCHPSVKTLLKIAKGLEVNVSVFFPED